MARIKSGVSSSIRKNAKNFIQKEAQLRLDETVAAFNMQVENSLFVNAVEIDYYQIQDKTGRTCTCDKIEILPEHKTVLGNSIHAIEPIVPTAKEDSSSGLGITLQDDDLFGDGPAEKLYSEGGIDVSGYDNIRDSDVPEEIYREVIQKDGDVSLVETSMFGNTANCGICYKVGYQPGYNAYRKVRKVLTTWDIENLGAYVINTAKMPNALKRQGPANRHSFVEFIVHVPKHFKDCVYSVRNNVEVLTEKLYAPDGNAINKLYLQSNAGKEISVRVVAQEFTHVVIEFESGVEKVRANIGVETEALDYNRLEAISNFPVILPPAIHDVNNGDIIVIRDRKLVLKILDKERKITSSKRQLEWSVQTRLVQKTEPLYNIAKGLRML